MSYDEPERGTRGAWMELGVHKGLHPLTLWTTMVRCKHLDSELHNGRSSRTGHGDIRDQNGSLKRQV
jgi:hypothetical protein